MIRSFQWDLARQVERLDWLIAQFPKYADWGYHEVHLHLEDAVEYPSLPGVARPGAYTYRQFERLVAAATRAGIKVVPIVNLLGHTQYLIKVPGLRDLNELRGADGSPLEHGQLCPLHPRTLEVAEKLLRDVSPFCTAGKVHVGLDESFHLGRHPLSQREIARIGLAAHFARYVGRLHTLARNLRLEMGMWADMLYFLPDAIPLLPTGLTAYEWYYYAFSRRPRIELFNFATGDLATPLRSRGIRLYGCPMNGAFRYEPMPHFHDRMENIVAWWRYARTIEAKGFLVSSWEPNRLSMELTTAVDAAAATLWLEPAVTDVREMLSRGFERAFGRKGRAAARVALACDRFPFSGYPRWEIAARWDTVPRRESPAPYHTEARFLERQSKIAEQGKLPAPVRASVTFRAYLAERDRLVHTAAHRFGAQAAQQAPTKIGLPFTAAEAAAAKKILARGRAAARVLWNRTRDGRTTGPNERWVEQDARRFRALARGEDAVLGPRWQLCYRVWNFAPAAQLVGIEQQQTDGTWRVLQSCHTIEFQARAAQPRGSIVREHAAPIHWEGAPGRFPVLRFFLQGLGRVKLGDVALTDGHTNHLPAGFSQSGWRILGRPAPRKGWPSLDWNSNRATLELRFPLLANPVLPSIVHD